MRTCVTASDVAPPKRDSFLCQQEERAEQAKTQAAFPLRFSPCPRRAWREQDGSGGKLRVDKIPSGIYHDEAFFFQAGIEL